MLRFKKLSGPFPLEAYVGLIPTFLDEQDSRSAKQQIHDAYGHGGGWFPAVGFTINWAVGGTGGPVLEYPGDPPLHPRAMAQLRNEAIYVYDSAWVAIVQPDLSVEIARVD